jgi:hypothetical protein
MVGDRPTDHPNGPVIPLTCRVPTDACSVAVPGIGRFGEIAICGQPTR